MMHELIIDHQVLFNLLCRRFKNRGLLDLLLQIIRSGNDVPGRGLPIGALCSQHFANYYLNSVDRSVLENSPASAVVRYMDDLVLWGQTKADVLQSLAVVSDVVTSQLKLELRESPIVNRVTQGISFCGFRVFPGIVRASLRRRRRYILARQRWEYAFNSGTINALELQRGYDSALGILAQVDSANWRRKQLLLQPPSEDCLES